MSNIFSSALTGHRCEPSILGKGNVMGVLSNCLTTGISDMENILCNIYLILSEVLYDQFRVRNTPIKELALPTRCIASTRDFRRADIELIKILMLIMLDFSNVSLHRCGLLIRFKGNISFWPPHGYLCILCSYFNI